MNVNTNENDDVDQKELDQAFNVSNGITEDNNDQTEPSTSPEVKEDVDNDQFDGKDSTETDPLADILGETQQTPTDEEDKRTQEEQEKTPDENDYVDLDGTPENDEDDGLIKADDPVGVQKRIGKEVQRRKALEATVAEIKAQNDQLMRMMMGQAPAPNMGPAMAPNGMQMPIPAFTPPAPPKAYEEMNDLEKVGYLLQVKQAEQQAQQVAAQQTLAQNKREADLHKVKESLRQNLHDPVINELYTKNPGHFTADMLMALSDYPNSASLIRYFHKNKNAELAALKTQSPDAQARGIVRMAERVNIERQNSFEKKAQAKKPAPAGKLKTAILPNTKGKRDIYTSEFLENLSEDQWNKLSAKGY